MWEIIIKSGSSQSSPEALGSLSLAGGCNWHFINCSFSAMWKHQTTPRMIRLQSIIFFPNSISMWAYESKLKGTAMATEKREGNCPCHNYPHYSGSKQVGSHSKILCMI